MIGSIRVGNFTAIIRKDTITATNLQQSAWYYIGLLQDYESIHQSFFKIFEI